MSEKNFYLGKSGDETWWEETRDSHLISLTGGAALGASGLYLGAGLHWNSILLDFPAYAGALAFPSAGALGLGLWRLDRIVATRRRMPHLLRRAGLVAGGNTPRVGFVWPTRDGCRVRLRRDLHSEEDWDNALDGIADALGWDGFTKQIQGDRVRVRFYVEPEAPQSDPEPIETRIGVGMNGDDEPIEIWPTVFPGHIAIQGSTRSGKSQLARSLILRFAQQMPTQVVGIDTTTSVLGGFKNQAPDLIHCAPDIEEDGSSAVAVLTRIHEEMKRRIRLMESRGVDKLGSPDEENPLLLVVVEELNSLRDDFGGKAWNEPQALLTRLLAQGAKANVVVLLIAQRFDAKLLGDGGFRNNVRYRFSLRSEASAIRMLHPDASEAASRFATGARDGSGIATAVVGGHPKADERAVFDGATHDEFTDEVERIVHPITWS